MADIVQNRKRMEEEKKRQEDNEIMLEKFMLRSELFDQTFTEEQFREIKEIFKRKNPNIHDPNALEILQQSISEWRQNNFGRLISSARPDKDGLITAYAGGRETAPVPAPPPSPAPPSAPSPAPPSAPSPDYDKEKIFSFDREGKLLTNAEDVRSLDYPFAQGQKRRRKSKKKSRKSKSSKKKSKSSKKKSKSSKKRSKSFKKNLRSKSKIKRK